MRFSLLHFFTCMSLSQCGLLQRPTPTVPTIAIAEMATTMDDTSARDKEEPEEGHHIVGFVDFRPCDCDDGRGKTLTGSLCHWTPGPPTVDENVVYAGNWFATAFSTAIRAASFAHTTKAHPPPPAPVSLAAAAPSLASWTHWTKASRAGCDTCTARNKA